MKWFIERVLPALLITLILYLVPIFLGVFQQGVFIRLLGGVTKADYDKLATEVQELRGPFAPSTILHSGDRISLKGRLNQSGHAVPGFVGVTPPDRFDTPTTVTIASAPLDDQVF